MAIIKAVTSKAKINQVIDYVLKQEKTNARLVSGKDCDPVSVKDEMNTTKVCWGKTGGRTYKHYVQSFAPNEPVTTSQAHAIAKAFADQCDLFQGFEVLIATHQDRKHVHTHFVVNSVSFTDGHKFQMSKNDLQAMRDLSDRLCLSCGLSVTKKGKTFEGEEREETSAYSKETYQLLKKAEAQKVSSYVINIGLAILECREKAKNKEEFIAFLSDKDIAVDWQDSHKYITFTDTVRQMHGEQKCKVRNNKLEKYFNIDFGKEALENGFKENVRKTGTASKQNTVFRESDRGGKSSDSKRRERQVENGKSAASSKDGIIVTNRSDSKRESTAESRKQNLN